jgi:hypothetical protein
MGEIKMHVNNVLALGGSDCRGYYFLFWMNSKSMNIMMKMLERKQQTCKEGLSLFLNQWLYLQFARTYCLETNYNIISIPHNFLKFLKFNMERNLLASFMQEVTRFVQLIHLQSLNYQVRLNNSSCYLSHEKCLVELYLVKWVNNVLQFQAYQFWFH